MTAVLNPYLYDAMARRFGARAVTVAHPGEPMAGEYGPDPARAGRYRLGIAAWGESYLTDCPFCRDDRRRLSVSHRYGEPDPVTHDRNLHLWRCYNEDCQRDPRNREELELALLVRDCQFDGPGPRLALPPIDPRPPGDLPPAPFPGRFVPLDRLPPDARPRAYLERDRVPGFDAAELAAVWGVGAAADMPPGMGWTEGRVAIPVADKGAVVGWQYRLAQDLPKAAYRSNPKYITYYTKSAVLYGLDLVPADAAVVPVVEGATDVWRYGPGAVARFGVKLSPVQVRKLVARAAGRTLLWIPDADDPNALPRAQEDILAVLRAGFHGRIGMAGLAPGTDPAKHTRPALHALATHVAASAVSV